MLHGSLERALIAGWCTQVDNLYLDDGLERRVQLGCLNVINGDGLRIPAVWVPMARAGCAWHGSPLAGVR